MDSEKFLQPTSKLSVRFNLVLIMLLLWTLSQLLIPVKFFSYGMILNYEYLKVAIPATGIVVSTLLYINRLKLNNNLWPFALFNILVLIIIAVKYIFMEPEIGVFQESAKYIIWSIAVFLLFPSVFNSLYKVKIFLRFSTALIVLFFVFIILAVFYLNLDTLYFSNGRLELFYGNPLYLGGIFYSLLCISLILRELSDSNFEKSILLMVVVLSMWVIYMAHARTFMLATLGIYLSYNFNIGRNLKKVSFVIFFILLSFVFIYIIFSESIDLNKLSSNRLLIWAEVMSGNLNYIQLLLGNYSDSGYIKETISQSGIGVKQTFQRFATDNSYIEIFINTGAIGLILFVLGLKKLFPIGMIKEFKKIDREARLVRVLSLAYGVLMSIVITGFFYGSFPSIGNTINSIVFPVVVSIILLLRRHIIVIRRLK